MTSLLRSVADAWEPAPDWQVSDWAEQRRHLSPEASAETGPWRNARTPHAVAPMDALSPYDEAERVVCKFASQCAKTEVILNFVGFIIDMDPGPTLAIQPNVKPMGEAFSKDRINPMLRDTPTLTGKVSTPKARSSDNTITHKTFAGGHLTIAGANSPAGLASRPIRYLLCDEIDRWDITKEGDPLLLARKRQQTFRARRRAKELTVSSPTFDDVGISAEYASCSQTWEWHIACQHCNAYQFPTISHFAWTEQDAETVRFICKECGAEHSTSDESAVKRSGKWVCTKDKGRRSVGFWFNEFASQFSRWDVLIGEWIDAQGDAAKMQVITNTSFATGWEGEGERVDASILKQREENYAADCPDGVRLITIGVDCQVDRIEAEVVGWGDRRESWSLDYRVLPGEPASGEVWDDLLDLFRTTYEKANGEKLSAVVMCIDSGAFTVHVYDFIKRAKHRGIIPIKGAAGMGRDQIDLDKVARKRREAKRLRNGKPPEILGVDSIKRTVYQYLAAKPDAVGYCHFPVGRSEEYYDQLTGERLDVLKVRGKRPQRYWKAIHPNVEALDARVYAYAGLLLFGVEKLQQTVIIQPRKTPNQPQPAASGPRQTQRRLIR